MKGPFEFGPSEEDIARVSRGFQVAGWQVGPVLAKGGRRPDQRIGSLNPQFGGEPWLAQHPEVGQDGGAASSPRQVLGRRRKQRVPAFIAGRRRLVEQERKPSVGRLRAVFLEEFPHQLPADLPVSGPQSSRMLGNRVL